MSNRNESLLEKVKAVIDGLSTENKLARARISSQDHATIEDKAAIRGLKEVQRIQITYTVQLEQQIQEHKAEMDQIKERESSQKQRFVKAIVLLSPRPHFLIDGSENMLDCVKEGGELREYRDTLVKCVEDIFPGDTAGQFNNFVQLTNAIVQGQNADFSQNVTTFHEKAKNESTFVQTVSSLLNCKDIPGLESKIRLYIKSDGDIKFMIWLRDALSTQDISELKRMIETCKTQNVHVINLLRAIKSLYSIINKDATNRVTTERSVEILQYIQLKFKLRWEEQLAVVNAVKQAFPGSHAATKRKFDQFVTLSTKNRAFKDDLARLVKHHTG
jgi:hypothetical protein